MSSDQLQRLFVNLLVLDERMVFISILLLFLFQFSSIYTGKSQDITSTINRDHYVPADVKRPFEIVNGNRFGVLCQSLLEIAYDSSCRIKAGDIIPDPTTISRCASRIEYSWSSRID